MGFIPITFDEFTNQSLGCVDVAFINRLGQVKHSVYQGETCMCGNRIWVMGSAFVGGNGCFSCITGKSNEEMSDNYEIDDMLNEQ